MNDRFTATSDLPYYLQSPLTKEQQRTQQRQLLFQKYLQKSSGVPQLSSTMQAGDKLQSTMNITPTDGFKQLAQTINDGLPTTQLNTLEEGTFTDGTEYRVNTTGREFLSPIRPRTPDVLKKIQFCKNRMTEKSLNLKHHKIFTKLNTLSKMTTLKSEEHSTIYRCYVDHIANAITGQNKEYIDRHLTEAHTWLMSQIEAIDYRNQLKGESRELEMEEERDNIETKRLLKMISDHAAKSKKMGDTIEAGRKDSEGLGATMKSKKTHKRASTFVKPHLLKPDFNKQEAIIQKEVLSYVNENFSDVRMKQQIRNQVFNWSKKITENSTYSQFKNELSEISSQF